MLGVSQGTVRNDLGALANGGQVSRVHGGAVPSGDQEPASPSFTARARKNDAAKLAIARWAAEMVEDGDSILLDASSTVFYMARFLKDRRKLRVITNGIEVARQLAANSTNTVILVGGVVNSDGSSITGSLGEEFFHGLHVQKAFVSGSGFTLEAGLTEVNIYEGQLKSRAIASADQVIALVDSSKFGKVDLTPFARTDQINCLFVDHGISPEWLEKLSASLLCFNVCDPEEIIHLES